MATSPSLSGDAIVRRRLRVAGVVQGVGFRPFVHRLATALDLAGHVGNDAGGVFVEVEGPEGAVGAFERGLVDDPPPLARITGVESAPMAALGEGAFRIVESHPAATARTFVSPDVAVCDDCLRELFDPDDLRYRHPFITCTNCGPRFTITRRLPYDRPNTTMAGFPMCDRCASQYRDPSDRRFHAQPLACPGCGPRLWFDGPEGRVEGSDAAIAAAQRAIAAGLVVAVKGLGGYHLACDALDIRAVGRLRDRKRRTDKPFAVMVGNLATVGRLVRADDDELRVLQSAPRPIVILARRRDAPIPPLVAPANSYVGIMLPYTPLHHLLFNAVPGVPGPVPEVLVMTSGNLGDEPICYDDGDARHRLGSMADAWLAHDRPIHVPCDDSVMRVVDGAELPIRRSRGYAPLPLRLPVETGAVLGVGGELKNTFCLASGRDAWLSQHIGDMGSLETLDAFERSTRQFGAMYDIEPAHVAADLHPGYHTRTWAEAHPAHGVELVQHHHAHLASVLAEHGVPAGERVLGMAFDGTGYGTDGAIWGGEVLLAGYDGFERLAHLRYVPLPGGDATIRRPYRAALAHLWAAGIGWDDDLAPVAAAGGDERAALQRQLDRDVQCVPTSSMGRLFDAVSSLLGVRHLASYEAQAAIELEMLAAGHLDAAPAYRFDPSGDEIDPSPVVARVVADLRAGRERAAIAAGFHVAVARLIADLADRFASPAAGRRVALSGGVFQNVLLLRLARAELAQRGVEALTHRLVPTNDGGLALGQVAVAACRQ